MWKQIVEPNLDPIIYQPAADGKSYALTDWVGWCLAYVATAFQSGWAGSSAWEAWNNTTKLRHTGRDFPVGVKFPIWFSGYGGDGHVAILHKASNGIITIWSSPYTTRKPTADILHSVEKLEQDLQQYNVKYVGWSEDIGGTTVIKSVGHVLSVSTGEEILLNEEGAKGLYRALLHREPENDTVWRGWQGKSFEEAYKTICGQDEWLMQNHVLKKAYPELIDEYKKTTAKVQVLQKKVSDTGALDAADEAKLQETLSKAVDALKTFEELQTKLESYRKDR